MSDKCVKCNLQFDQSKDKDLVGVCCECSGYYHAACCSAKTWQAWTKRNAKRNEWKCDSCRAETASTHSKSDNESTGNSAVLAVLDSMRKEMADNHRDTKRRFDVLDQSINTLRESVVESQQKIKILEEENVSVKEKLERCMSDIDKNNKEMSKMHQELQDLQQYSRRHNIEIKGVPFTMGENVYTILERVAGALDVQWHRGDISIAHRLKTPPTGHPAIVAAFIHRGTRSEWLSAARFKKLSTTDLSPKLPAGPVYINSHLSPHNKQLLGRARQLVRDRKLGSAWASDDGKVMVRRMSGSRPFRVTQMEDFDKVIE